MPQQWCFEHTIGHLLITAVPMGSDLAITICGSDVPHIGSTVLAQPRSSLTGAGTSATSSVLNAIGHKDEFVARPVAEGLATKLCCTVSCTCGIHKNNATPEDIATCVNLGEEIAAFILNSLERTEQ